MLEKTFLPPEASPEEIETTIKKLIKRHESLRTSFHIVDNTPVQVVHDKVPFNIQSLDLDDSQHLPHLIMSFTRPFDLSQPPLIRVLLIKMEDKYHIFI